MNHSLLSALWPVAGSVLTCTQRPRPWGRAPAPALGRAWNCLLRSVPVPHRPSSLDGILAGTVFVLAFVVGAANCIFWYRPFHPEAGAAVSWACGRGYVNPDPAGAPGLAAFVERDERARTLSCDVLSPDLPALPLSTAQRQDPYGMLFLGTVWRLLGPSWDVVWIISAFFHAVASVAVYAIFRLAMRPWLALAATFAIIFSPLQLSTLPRIRDSNRAPFFLWLFFVMGYILCKRPSTRTLLALGALSGALLGIALGFRPDYLILIPPILLVLLAAECAQVRTVPQRVSACLLFFLTFTVVGAHVLLFDLGDSGSYLVLIHGVSDPFTRSLGLESSVYRPIPVYDDDFIRLTPNTAAYRTTGSQEWSREGTETSPSSRPYFAALVATFPADMFVRTIAAILNVMDIPFGLDHATYVEEASIKENPPELDALNSYLVNLRQLYSRTMATLAGAGPFLVCLALFLIAVRNFRRGVLLGCLLLYVAGYTALQFQSRQIYHLEFIGVLSVGIIVEQAIRCWRAAALHGRSLLRPWPGGSVERWSGPPRRREPERQPGARHASTKSRWDYAYQVVRPESDGGRVARAALCLACVVLLSYGTLRVLREYQRERLVDLFSAYEHASRSALLTAAKPLAEGARSWVVEPQDFPRASSYVEYFATSPAAPYRVSTEYLVAEFWNQCEVQEIAVEFRYRGPTPDAPGRSERLGAKVLVPLAAAGQVTTVFFPVYSGVETHVHDFQGLVLDNNAVPCFRSLSVVSDTSGMALLPVLVLRPDWQEQPLYQRLAANPREKLIDDHLPTPDVAVAMDVGRWRLLGYDVDEAALVSGQAADFKLYWLAPPDVVPLSSPTFYRQFGQRWIQMLPASRNLVEDGGFAGPEPFAGFPMDVYSGDLSPRSVVKESRNGVTRPAAVLSNRPDHRRSSLVSSDIAVDPETYYLQSAWVRAEAGNAYVGRQWLPSGSYEYAKAGVTARGWQRVAEILTPPVERPDTALRVWLLNYETDGQALFGDVALVPIGRRAYAACEPARGAARVRCGPPLRATDR